MKSIFFFPIFFVLFVTATLAASVDNIPEPVTDPAQAFVSGAIIARGAGVVPHDKSYTPPQRRLLALRAARLDALREAAGVINGVLVTGETTVVDAAAVSGQVGASVNAIVRGAEVVKEVYDPVSGEAAVYVSVPMTGQGGVVGQLMPHLASDYKREYPAYMPLVSSAGGSYDGLIIDVRHMAFKPALINRVVTDKGELVFDPASAEQGAYGAGYTSDIDRARALLSERGSTRPLVISAASVINSTDVVITPEQAGAVVSSDRSAGFLEKALVIFVLK